MPDYSDLYKSSAQQYGEDPLWVQAMAQQESQENPDAVSSAGASGVMQLIPDTAKAMGVKDSSDPKQNIPGGVHYYHNQRQKYDDPNIALMAYNWGPGNVDKWIENGSDWNKVPAETRDYVGKINERYKKLKGPVVTKMEQSPAAYQSTQAQDDPIATALSEETNEKNLPAGADSSHNADLDPISAALSEPSGSNNGVTTASSKSPGILEDVAKSIPSAAIRGIGAIPQAGPYAGNMIAQVMGQGWGAAHDLFADTPYTKEQRQRLNNVEPFYTGATLGDEVTKIGAGLAEGIGGTNLSPEQKQKLQALQEHGLIEDQLHIPQTRAGRLTSAAIQGTLGGAGTIGAGAIKSGLSGLGAGLAQDQYPDNPTAALLGGLAVPAASKIVGKTLGKTTPEIANAAKSANDIGVKVPPGLMSDSPMVHRAYSMLDRMGFTNDNRGPQFTKAVGNLFGANSDKLTNPVMADAKDQIVKGYDQVAQMAQRNGGIEISNNTLNKLLDLKDNAVEGAEPVDKFWGKLSTALGSGNTLDAPTFKKLTQTGSYIDNLTKSNKPELRDLGRNIEKLLNDDLATSAGPAAKDLMKDTDRKYALWNIANEARDDTTGQINPAAFKREAWKKNDRYFKTQQNLRNPSDTYKLAQTADMFRLTPSSNTAENYLTAKMLGAFTAPLVGGYALGGPAGAALGAGGAWAGSKALGSALSSNWYRNHLINKALNPSPNIPINHFLYPTAISHQPQRQ